MLGVGSNGGVATEAGERLETELDRIQAQLLQPSGGRGRERALGQALESAAVPHRERLVRVGERLGVRARRQTRPDPVQQLLEPVGVDRLGRDVEQVAARLGSKAGADVAAQVGDVALERGPRRSRWVVVPEGVDQVVAAAHTVDTDQQRREQRNPLGATEVDRVVAVQ